MERRISNAHWKVEQMAEGECIRLSGRWDLLANAARAGRAGLSSRRGKKMMKRVFLMSLCASMIVSGCAEKVSPLVKNRYTLAPLEAPLPEGECAQPHPVILRVARIDAPDWLNSVNIYYQLLYQDRHEIASYSRSRWISPPPLLIERLIQDALVQQNSWKAVIGPNNEARADLALQLHLAEFQQIFTAPEQSYGLLQVVATLVDNNNAQVIAQRTFQEKVPAPSPNAAGGAQALNSASQRWIKATAQWLGRVMKTYPRSGC